METNELSKATWGGARKGAGRKKTCAKRVFFSANQEVADILDAHDGNLSEFINECIVKAMGMGG